MSKVTFKIVYPQTAVDFASDKKINSLRSVVDVALCTNEFYIALEYRSNGFLLGYKTMNIEPDGSGYSIDKYYQHEY